MAAPKPETLDDGRVVEIARACENSGGGVIGRWVRPHVARHEFGAVDATDCFSTDIYPNVRALRKALRDGTAVLECDADRQQRSKPYKRID